MIHKIDDNLYLVSPADIEVNEATFGIHLEWGQLVYTRTELELFDNNDVYRALADMIERGAKKSAQRMLMLCNIDCGSEKFGEVARRWIYRGGVVYYCAGDVQLALKKIEKELKGLSSGETKQLLQNDENDDPLQGIEIVDDWRKTLITFPSIGMAKANQLKKEYGDSPFWNILHLITRKSDPILGKAVREKSRAWLGLEDNEDLMIVEASNGV